MFPSLIELLVHDQWPVRLGAMVTVEELAAVDADLAQALIDRVWDRFEAAGNPAKGDMLYLIGESAEGRDIETDSGGGWPTPPRPRCGRRLRRRSKR